jgi:hypothetical protein
MLNFRAFTTAILVVGFLAGCETTTSLEEATLGDSLNIVSVVVETDALSGVSGRAFSRSNAQIGADIQAAAQTALRSGSDPDGLPSEVRIDVTEVTLANAVDRAVAQASLIRADLTVIGQGGSIIVPTQEVVGTSEGLRLGGTIGALTTPGVNKDYSDTVAGFAATLKSLLFPEQ